MDGGIARRAQRIQTMVLQAMARIGQAKVADLIGKAPSTVVVFKDEHLLRMCEVLAACGLKAVNDTDQSLDQEELHAISVLARKHLEARAEAQESGFGNA